MQERCHVEQTVIEPAPTSSNGRAVHNAARSNHTGGVNLGMADGSVSFVSDNVELIVWQAMSTMNGNETVSIAD